MRITDVSKFKFSWWLTAIAAILFFLTAVTLKSFTTLAGGLATIRLFLTISIFIYFVYPIISNLTGVTVSREQWKFKLRYSQNSTLSQIIEFMVKLLQGIRVGIRDWDEFRNGLAGVDSILMQKEFFAVIVSVVLCFHLGLLNMLFPVAFGYVVYKQFDLDFAASVHVTSCEIYIGLMTSLSILLFHPGLWILAVYPVFSIIWILLYSRDKYMTLPFIGLQCLKVIIYAASKYIPYLVLSTFSLPF